jgi:DNA polymerase III delta prime subunit
MRGSIIIFGGNKNRREEKVIEIVNKEENKSFEKIKDLTEKPDIHIIDLGEKERSIGIADTRKGSNFLKEKPFSYQKKFLIILNADKLTTQAQNSLLKTLEEPPQYAVIILSARTQNSLLETIISRCRLISLKNERESDSETDDFVSFKKIINMKAGERIDVCTDLSKCEKEIVLEVLEKWAEEGREVLLENPKDSSNMKNLKRVIEVKKDLENTNVNIRLSLEALVLTLS